MTRKSDLKKIRELLQQKRQSLTETARQTRHELMALKEQERDPEYEEMAQSELADFTLSSLLESHRRELQLIEAAFARMDQGIYGTCVDCEGEINWDRLLAVPYAIRCEEDARRHESDRLGGGRYSAPTL